jgi:hypothetical protein
LTHLDDRIAGAVLDDPAWQAAEQLTVAGRAHTSVVVGWLVRLDPDVPSTSADLVDVVGPGRRLAVRLGDSPLPAMLRRAVAGRAAGGSPGDFAPLHLEAAVDSGNQPARGAGRRRQPGS